MTDPYYSLSSLFPSESKSKYEVNCEIGLKGSDDETQLDSIVSASQEYLPENNGKVTSDKIRY